MLRWLTTGAEAFRFAWIALVTNRLRTFLSLLGITIGIFAIIAVYAVVGSLEKNIRDTVASLGTEVVYVQKWPWGGGMDMPWWKYIQRKEVDFADFEMIRDRGLSKASAIGFITGADNLKFEFGSSNVSGVTARGITMSYGEINGMDLASGRYFSGVEMQTGQAVVILGHDVADGLFPSGDAVGKKVKVNGREFAVIGVMAAKGASMVGENEDQMALIPVRQYIRSIGRRYDGGALQIKAREGVEIKALKQEIRTAMRGIRRLKPKADDDFSMNESSTISSNLDSMFSVIRMAGTFIGSFSILVGGFGIANIMFVSVRERTGQIGIQKALGAKRHFILAQFILESTLLSVVGGLAGLILVAVLVQVISSVSEFSLYLSMSNVVTGILLSAAIGVVAGLVPAFMAARMDPVNAIRFNQ